MPEPEYHRQPHTQDPTKEEIPDDAPLAQGHSPEIAEDVKAAAAEHKQAVQDEAQARERAQAEGQPLPGEPGDPTRRIDPETGQPVDETPEGSAPDAYPADGSVDDVLAWVGSDHDRAQQALAREHERSTPRTTLISRLEAI